VNTDQAPPSDEIDNAIAHATRRGHRVALASAWVRVILCLLGSVAVLVGSLFARSVIAEQRLEAGTGTAAETAGSPEGPSASPDSISPSIVGSSTVPVPAVRAPSPPVLVINFEDPSGVYVELTWTMPEGSGPIDSFVVFRDEVAVHSGIERSYRTAFDGDVHRYFVRAVGPAETADSNQETFPSRPTPPSTSTDPVTPSRNWKPQVTSKTRINPTLAARRRHLHLRPRPARSSPPRASPAERCRDPGKWFCQSFRDDGRGVLR